MLPIWQRRLLKATTHNVWEALIKLQRALPLDTSRLKSRLRWALLDRHAIKKLELYLSEAEQGLDSLLQVVGL
jgi:hypothetical protein